MLPSKRVTVHSAQAQLRQPRRLLQEIARDLARSPEAGWRLFLANTQARHRQAALGYVWLIMPQLVMTGIWVFLREQHLIDVRAGELPYAAFVLAGMLLWQLFVDALNAPLNQILAAKAMVTRGGVPLEGVLLASVLEVLLNCLVRFSVLIPAWVAFGLGTGWTTLLVPFGLAGLLLLGFGIGLVLAPLGLLYEDVRRGLPLLVGMAFFLTPVVYNPPASGILRANPVMPLLDSTRHWLAGTTASSNISTGDLFVAGGGGLALVLIGYLLLRVARPHLLPRLG